MDNTVIRRGVKLDNLIQIAHNCEVGEHTVMASQVGLAGSSAVGKWCRFGGQVGIGGHLTIGDRVEMAGQTGVLGNVASGTALMGSPGMPLREAMRSFVIQPKLPDMYRRLQALEKELAELKQKQGQLATKEDIERIINDALKNNSLQNVISKDQINALVAFAQNYQNTSAIDSKQVLEQLNSLSKSVGEKINSLVEQAKNEGWLDKIAQFFQSIFDAIKNLFSQN